MTAAKLRTVLGDHAHVQPLKRGQVRSDQVALDFIDFSPTNAAFKPMVREQKFDVCEMAIVTYLMARAHNKPLVLLPATMLGRFQHAYALYNAERSKRAWWRRRWATSLMRNISTPLRRCSCSSRISRRCATSSPT